MVVLYSFEFVVSVQTSFRFVMKQSMLEFSNKKGNPKAVSVVVERLVLFPFWLNHIGILAEMKIKSYSQVSNQIQQKYFPLHRFVNLFLCSSLVR